MDAEVADDAAGGAEDKPTRGRGPARSDHVLTGELVRGRSAARAVAAGREALSAPKAISRARRTFEGQMRPLDEIEGVVSRNHPLKAGLKAFFTSDRSAETIASAVGCGCLGLFLAPPLYCRLKSVATSSVS
jgi:hypothetical protein